MRLSWRLSQAIWVWVMLFACAYCGLDSVCTRRACILAANRRLVRRSHLCMWPQQISDQFPLEAVVLLQQRYDNCSNHWRLQTDDTAARTRHARPPPRHAWLNVHARARATACARRDSDDRQRRFSDSGVTATITTTPERSEMNAACRRLIGRARAQTLIPSITAFSWKFFQYNISCNYWAPASPCDQIAVPTRR